MLPTPPTPTEPEPVVSPGTDYPTVGLDADGLPLATVGTLVVYAKHLSQNTKLEVVTFDLQTGRRLSDFRLEAPRYVQVERAGNRVVATFDGQLWSYALDGSDGLLLEDELPTTYLMPSPDGGRVALSGWSEDRSASVAIVDVNTGEHLSVLDLQEQFADWKGEPAISHWISEDELVVVGVCNCDSGPPGYFAVTIDVNGSVDRASKLQPERGPREVVFGEGFSPRCRFVGYAGSRTVSLVDGATGAVLAEASESAPVLAGVELSPDGTEVLVISLDANKELRAHLNSVVESGECEDGGASGWGAPRLLSLLREGATTLEPIESRLEVLKRWYEPLPIFECDGEQRAGWYGSVGLEHPQWVSPVGYADHIAFTSRSCRGDDASVDMRIGSVLVDSGVARYRVLGFFDKTPALED